MSERPCKVAQWSKTFAGATKVILEAGDPEDIVASEGARRANECPSLAHMFGEEASNFMRGLFGCLGIIFHLISEQ